MCLTESICGVLEARRGAFTAVVFKDGMVDKSGEVRY